MRLKKSQKAAIKSAIIVLFIMLGIILLLSLIAGQGRIGEISEEPVPAISKEIVGYEPLVEKYAAEYEIEEHTDVLLAIMMQESGGRGADPMQSSESYCGERGCISDPEESIRQGVYYFSRILEEAGGDLELAVQSYNFGRGFIHYVKERQTSFTPEIAIEFSQKKYSEAEDQSVFRCPREGAREIGACYGDFLYVESVMEYKSVIAKE